MFEKSHLFLFAILSGLVFSCSITGNPPLPAPKIQQGVAKIDGKIIGYQDTFLLTLTVPSPITGEKNKYETMLKQDGGFSFEVPVECSHAQVFLSSPIFDNTIVLILKPGEKITMTISRDKTGLLQMNLDGDFPLTDYDRVNIANWDMWEKLSKPRPGNTLFPCPGDTTPIYKMSSDEFAQCAIEEMMQRIEYALTGVKLSEAAKNYVSNQFKLFYLRGYLLSYTHFVSQFKFGDVSDPQEPGKSYYSFLKQFDLNNSQYLYSEGYSSTLQKILSTDTLDIPPIGDTPIKDWLKIVKNNIADLVGFDRGLFYDLLASHTYITQLNSLKPLSDKQKENIQAYFAKSENKDIAPILLMKNEEVIKFNEAVKPLVVHQTPEVPKEKLMDAIIAKYKGKTVVVDFWATWCGPCLEGINYSKELKIQMKDKDVVFVYITNVSSPKALWDKTIPNIRGEHYYLAKEQWDYILDSFGVRSIPMYLFYDADGAFKEKQVGYPGNSKMEEIINRLLQ